MQGKHKAQQASTRLYSRDDVHGALQFQESIVSAVQNRFRPSTPLGRGGQHPMEEPTFQLQQFAKDAPAYTWKYFQFHLKPAVPIETTDLFELSDAPGSGETDSSTSSSSSASEQQDPPAITQRDECADEVFGALHRSMWHVSMEAPPREQSGLKPMHCVGSDVAAKGYCGGPPGQSQIMSDKEKCFSIRHWLNWETDAVSPTTRYEKIL